MKTALFCLVIIIADITSVTAQGYDDRYIDEWIRFYPSRALAQGMHNSIFYIEDLSSQRINQWLIYNKKMLSQTDSALEHKQGDRINLRLLRTQIRTEIDKWELDAPHQRSLSLYSSLIVNGGKRVMDASFLTPNEKVQLICERFGQIQKLCNSAKSSIQSVDQGDLERSLRQLEAAEKFYKDELLNLVGNQKLSVCSDFKTQSSQTADNIRSLITFINSEILPRTKETEPILGRDEYTRKLSLYVDASLTPEKLADMALQEIEMVRKLMGEVAQSYFVSNYPKQKLPSDYNELMRLTLADMEKDAPKSGPEYLEFWKGLSQSSIKFIEEKKIATLPKNETLQILTAPESAGPAARIGWVSSAPPFSPNPLTTLYVPSIPESFPDKERTEFWASFNRPFNRIIVIHELYPGHYMQNKIARESPHSIRLLFPFGIYSEGWATFCERVALDAGWEAQNKLTLLAHLRKRLENANRAYTSVMVHCNGWDKDKTISFSIEKSLLAPQFAKSLWGRLVDSPMQMTSYFLGGTQFNELLAHEQKRLGTQFNLTEFMDTILRAGPIPIDEFYEMFNPSLAGK
ncbi:MAG: DUF885 domain-containing protein [Flammeovirgaceae bacterium]|nr:DUF885 domain-containing protein [Flammeovirgaceae bacterium]